MSNTTKILQIIEQSISQTKSHVWKLPLKNNDWFISVYPGVTCTSYCWSSTKIIWFAYDLINYRSFFVRLQ